MFVGQISTIARSCSCFRIRNSLAESLAPWKTAASIGVFVRTTAGSLAISI